MKQDSSFPWRDNNSFQLLVDSDFFYPRMLIAIEKAQKFIFLEQYLVNSGKILDKFILTLTKTADRGVGVFIIFDDYGTSGIRSTDIERLKHRNIHIMSYNPFHWRKLYKSLQRDHRKLLLIDNQFAFVGGAGITDHYLNEDPSNAMSWHDVVLQIQGPIVIDWYHTFAQLWHKLSLTKLPPTTSHESVNELPQSGQVLLAEGPGRNSIIKSALHNIRKSQEHVWIASPYFVTTRKLRHALSKAAKRGVDVRLLLPGSISDHQWVSQAARHYYTQLLHNQVKIYEYQPRFIHAKIILVDDWVSIGSSNLDRWSQYWNLDANQAVRDKKLLAQTNKMFSVDFEQSKFITYAHWKQRPWSQRLLEWWASYIARIIQWLIYLSSRAQNKKHSD